MIKMVRNATRTKTSLIQIYNFSSGYDDGDDFQNYYQEEDDNGEEQDDGGNIPEDERADRTMFVKSQSIDQNQGENAKG